MAVAHVLMIDFLLINSTSGVDEFSFIKATALPNNPTHTTLLNTNNQEQVYSVINLYWGTYLICYFPEITLDTLK